MGLRALSTLGWLNDTNFLIISDQEAQLACALSLAANM